MAHQQDNVQRVAAYYAAQADEYEEISGIGTDLFENTFARLKKLYQNRFAGLDVLELACGTGYWTAVLATTAKSVLATDVNPELVALSGKKLASVPNVRCEVASAYSLDSVNGTFSAAFAHFWLSHVPKKKLRSFLETLNARLRPDALVMFADLLEYQPKWGQRRVDEHGDLYEDRMLRDGRRFETIKNFPTEKELTGALRGIANEIEYTIYRPENIWAVFYRVKR